jgi:Rhodopirellula transposase DDE domain
MDISETIATKFQALRPFLDERRRRLWAAAEALALGWGGVTTVAAATGLHRNTVSQGLRELRAVDPDGVPSEQRIRAVGGGRKAVTERDPTLLADLEALVEPLTRGDPMSPLRWTCKSTRQLATELSERGHQVSHQTVAELLRVLGYSLQGTRKITEGTDHPDRDAQFSYLNAQVQAVQERSQPVISVDCKKKELVGDFANQGREWQPQGHPEEVRIHDFVDPELGKAIPYGVYDIAGNCGWVTVGTDHDTPAFAVAAVGQW